MKRLIYLFIFFLILVNTKLIANEIMILKLEYGNVEYAVIDIQGKTIVTNYAAIAKGLNKIEMKKNLKAGLYFIEFANERIKFVVQ